MHEPTWQKALASRLHATIQWCFPQARFLAIFALRVHETSSCSAAAGDSGGGMTAAVPIEPPGRLPEVPELGDIMHMLKTPGVDIAGLG